MATADTNTNRTAPLFSALLKYWRRKRGLSQLDLALSADVSARHISFLETGRSQPSEEMVLRLAATLDVPLRNQNDMLRATDFPARFATPDLDSGLTPAVERALKLMMAQHNPFPITIINRKYDILRMSVNTQRLLTLFIKDQSALTTPLNVYHLLFNPRLIRPAVINWEQIAHDLFSRLHREALHHPDQSSLRELVDQLQSYPGVLTEWCQPDFSTPDDAAYAIRFRNDQMEVAFLTTVTTFSAPGNITLEELRIESYYPLDEETERICHSFAET